MLGTSGAALLTAMPGSGVFAGVDDILDFRRNAPVIPLHFNENALGMSQKSIKAAQTAVAHGGHRYADEHVERLRNVLADAN